MRKRARGGQKAAVKAVRSAADALIAQVLASEWVEGCVEFQAFFHLESVRYDKASWSGRQGSTRYKFFKTAFTRNA